MRERRERRGVNPQTRQEMVIPASKTPSFSASNRLKDMVRESKSREHGGSS
jgi:DNA-binding protein HU-beta